MLNDMIPVPLWLLIVMNIPALLLLFGGGKK